MDWFAGVLVATVIGIAGLLLDRRDKRKADNAKIKEHPDNPDGVAAAQRRVQDLKKQIDSGL
ncbi:MAG: hypothetical protein WC959_07685 [Kiritimatiellales bacterium]